MTRSLLEFHILERRAEGGWRVKERGPDLTDVLVVDFETLQEADSWITARQDGSKTQSPIRGQWPMTAAAYVSAMISTFKTAWWTRPCGKT